MFISESEEFDTDRVSNFDAIREHITDLVRSVPFATLPGHSKHAKLAGHIPTLNALFAERLHLAGWTPQLVLADGSKPDAYKVIDGTRVAVEVQFGNHAMDSSDFTKLMSLKLGVRKGPIRSGPLIDLCVRIALDKPTEQLCSSGLASHPAFCKLMKLIPGITPPVWSSAISAEGVPRVDASPAIKNKNAIKNAATSPDIIKFAEAYFAKMGTGSLPGAKCQAALF